MTLPSQTIAHRQRTVRRTRHVACAIGLAGGLLACGDSSQEAPTVLFDAGARPLPDAPSFDRIADTELDPGYVGPRRLSKREYVNTVWDLLGVPATEVPVLPEDVSFAGFDNTYEVSGFWNDVPREYPVAAQAIASAAFADPALRSRIVTCSPAASAESAQACALDVIRAFGLRAFRRPLTEREEADFVAVLALGGPSDDFDAAIRRVVEAMLSSKSFLFRIEVDPDPTSIEPHPVTPYELASRLSYLVWSTMPDDALFAVAADGSLVRSDVLSAELRRMLADPRSERFPRDFGDAWLGIKGLREHVVATDVFPTFDEPLRASMLDEMRRYVGEFMNDRSFGEFLTADMNFVDERLARHYGFSILPPAGTVARVEVRDDKRQGYLSLAGFLTVTSHDRRTSPMLRGKWVIENVLCLALPPPPPNVPVLTEPVENESIRAYFEGLVRIPECSFCHTQMDGVGLGMQDFDAIGRPQTVDQRGYRIDASGVTPDGTEFYGAGEVGVALSKDPRFLGCATRHAITYAIGRMLDDDADRAYVDQVLGQWRPSLRLSNLLEQIVSSGPFRKRRAKGP